MPALSIPTQRVTRSFAAVAAAAALAIGGYAIGHSSSSTAASPTGFRGPAGQFGPRFGQVQGQQAGQVPGLQPGQGPAQQTTGQVPAGWRPGTGTIITGASADKAKAAAVAQYPGGTVNRVLQLSDGSYAVHRIGTPAPHHIFVSMDFKVTGTA
jgi:hypothetical protein